MLGTYITGIFGVVGLMAAWVVVQQIWKQVFSEHVSDEDALAERTRCTNCGCTTVCKKREQNRKNTLSGRVTILK